MLPLSANDTKKTLQVLTVVYSLGHMPKVLLNDYAAHDAIGLTCDQCKGWQQLWYTSHEIYGELTQRVCGAPSLDTVCAMCGECGTINNVLHWHQSLYQVRCTSCHDAISTSSTEY